MILSVLLAKFEVFTVMCFHHRAAPTSFLNSQSSVLNLLESPTRKWTFNHGLNTEKTACQSSHGIICVSSVSLLYNRCVKLIKFLRYKVMDYQFKLQQLLQNFQNYLYFQKSNCLCNIFIPSGFLWHKIKRSRVITSLQKKGF